MRTERRILIFNIISLWCLGCIATTIADNNELNLKPNSQMQLVVTGELTIIDLPFNLLQGGRFPSMNQSLAVTTGIYALFHSAIGHLWTQINWGPYDTLIEKSLRGCLKTKQK